MKKYAFWNNKGGTGKTSLAFQVICEYARSKPTEKILAIDVCPQANLSEIFLGGLQHGGSDNLLKRQGESVRATIGGYFQIRMPSPFSVPSFSPQDYLTKPSKYNEQVPENIDLLCGDPLLELQSNAMSTLANTQIPGTNTWISIIDWLNDFIKPLSNNYDVVFIDTNPSFSIYTQIALSVAEKLLLPVMADDSSRRAIQNVFSLIYGLKLPAEIYAKYAFAEKLKEVNRSLPKVHLIMKNRLTQYMGAASAYSTVLTAIDDDIKSLLASQSSIFTFDNLKDGMVDVRDFQTTGVVAFARGCPFYKLSPGRLDLLGQRVQVKEEYRKNCIENIQTVVDKL
ncbi:MAG: ATPase [Parcubacteria group bacterium GW2011_GWC2_39_14]|nr:MAG: ATPase [Parcubacteria group bacterium GW2011_GWC2_39_14]KKR55299.1 MAG: ATPase [Parcubacteria group bacterium GW2011_GWA2_40_23]